MTLSRRQMFKLSAGAAATWITGMGLSRSRAAAITKKIPIGLELWSVRHQCEKELPTVLRAIGKMGYESVEMAHSYYGHSASTWRKLLDENGHIDVACRYYCHHVPQNMPVYFHVSKYFPFYLNIPTD